MDRYENSPELFGCGMGVSSVGPLYCELCGRVHNKGNEDKKGDIIDQNVESVCWTNFAGKQICECCFEIIEREILYRMKDILPWYTRYLATKRAKLERAEKATDQALKGGKDAQKEQTIH